MKVMVIAIRDYLDEIKTYLKDIKVLKKPDTWKIQSIIANNFISSKVTDEVGKMHSKNDNIKIIIYDKIDETVQEHFESLYSRCQTG